MNMKAPETIISSTLGRFWQRNQSGTVTFAMNGEDDHLVKLNAQTDVVKATTGNIWHSSISKLSVLKDRE